MTFKVCSFSSDVTLKWDPLVEQSNGGTLFHRHDFLAYHGDRFQKNEHHLVIYKGQTLCGVMPMAIFEEEGRRVAKSPYGGSYGGPVFPFTLNYANSHEIISDLLNLLSQLNVTEFRMTMPIAPCFRCYSETFYLVLLERGFKCVNQDISSVVYLGNDKPILENLTSRVRNMVRKARKENVEINRQASILEFWQVLEKTFEKHGNKPTHTLTEFEWLHEHFPERVYVDVAYFKGKAVAGIGYFVINDRVNSSFYLCQDPEKQHTQALSLLIYDALEKAQQNGFSWFDFGTSSVNMHGRANVFLFKEGFGSIGVFRNTYTWYNVDNARVKS